MKTLGKNNPLLQSKTYCSIPKTFYNDKKNSINSTSLVDNNFIEVFHEYREDYVIFQIASWWDDCIKC